MSETPLFDLLQRKYGGLSHSLADELDGTDRPVNHTDVPREAPGKAGSASEPDLIAESDDATKDHLNDQVLASAGPH